MVDYYTHFHGKKGYTNFGHKGVKYVIGIYILNQEVKTKLFSQCPSVRPTVRKTSVH